MHWYPYGHDFGNTQIGGVTLIGGHLVSESIPTAIVQADPTTLRNLGVETTAAHLLQMQGEAVSYALGELALQQAMDPWSGLGDIERYASPSSLRGLLAVAASLIADPEFGLCVVTGLPAETYITNTALRHRIKSALDGTYTFTTNGGLTWRTVHIEVANVVMEGAGALIAYSDQHRSRTAESAVIDIGGRTTDLYVARRQVPVTDFCAGKPLGVESATQLVMSAFEHTCDRPLSRLEARELMHAYASQGARAYPELTVYGHPIEPSHLERLAREAIDQVGLEITSFVAARWRQSDRGAVAASFQPVLAIGGGVYYFFADLKRRIPHLLQVSDPIHANAIGYCTLAARLLHRRQGTQGIPS